VIDNQAQPEAGLVRHDIRQRAEIDLDTVGLLRQPEQAAFDKSVTPAQFWAGVSFGHCNLR
jgi:hypothetical protein